MPANYRRPSLAATLHCPASATLETLKVIRRSRLSFAAPLAIAPLFLLWLARGHHLDPATLVLGALVGAGSLWAVQLYHAFARHQRITQSIERDPVRAHCELTIDDAGITVSSARGVRHFLWTDVEKLQSFDHALVLQIGGRLLTLPEAQLTPTLRKHIRDRARRSQ